MSNPTANWEKLGDRFYRKVKLYDAVFDQDLELENYLLTGAPYSGAIGILVHREQCTFSDGALALYRDEGKLHGYRGTQSAKSGIDIYSCSGKIIRHINVGTHLIKKIQGTS